MSDSVAIFVAEVRRYCRLIEDDESDNSWVFARDCLTSVLRLYAAALELPAKEPGTVEALNRIDDDAWQRVCQRVGRKLARDCYWEVYEPLEQAQPQSLCGSLSDDLADIWRDVKDGLLSFDSGKQSAVDGAVWHWRFSLESHWGHHAVGAIAALNALCFGPFADVSRPTGTNPRA